MRGRGLERHTEVMSRSEATKPEVRSSERFSVAVATKERTSA